MRKKKKECSLGESVWSQKMRKRFGCDSRASISRKRSNFLSDLAWRLSSNDCTGTRATSRNIVGIVWKNMWLTIPRLSCETDGRLFNDTLRRSTKNFSVGETRLDFGACVRLLYRGELTTSQANLFRDALLMPCTRTLPLCTIKEKETRERKKKKERKKEKRWSVYPRPAFWEWRDVLEASSTFEFEYLSSSDSTWQKIRWR